MGYVYWCSSCQFGFNGERVSQPGLETQPCPDVASGLEAGPGGSLDDVGVGRPIDAKGIDN